MIQGDREFLIERSFLAFEWRDRPSRIFPEFYITEDGKSLGTHFEGEAFEKHLVDIEPRDLSFAVLDANPAGDRTSLLTLAHPEGALYFLPAVIALCVMDRERADFLVDVLAWQIRCCAGLGEVASWAREFEIPPVQADDDQIENMRRWFLDAEAGRNRLMGSMTGEERTVLSEYFAFEAKAYGSRYFTPSQFIERRAAVALLQDRSYAERLGARNRRENEALIDTLAVLRRRLPGTFDVERTETVEAALRESLGGWSATV